MTRTRRAAVVVRNSCYPFQLTLTLASSRGRTLLERDALEAEPVSSCVGNDAVQCRHLRCRHGTPRTRALFPLVCLRLTSRLGSYPSIDKCFQVDDGAEAG